MVDTFNAKAVLLGEPAVGKTSIRKRYMGEGFTSSHLLTIGADFAQKKIKLDNGLNDVILQIWDVAGQDEFRQVRSRFLLNANICLMVFDLTRRETFHAISSWMQDFWEINPHGEIPLLIIGNKADLEGQIKVEEKEIEGIIQILRASGHSTADHITYIKTSAATGLNIEDAFNRVAREITDIYLRTYK